MRKVSLALNLALLALLASCASPPRDSGGGVTNAGRYEMDKDSGLIEPIDFAQVKPVIPRREARTSAGNKSPYVVNGKTYRVLSSEEGYTETGVASWYGRKFHGHRTSNGEVYDMFQLSAAHPVLPIPSYVRVTNLDNGRNVLVRINDRGPFHPGRVIDLSYAGAAMLGYAGTGTARVRVEAVMPEDGAVASAATLRPALASAPVSTPIPTPRSVPVAAAPAIAENADEDDEAVAAERLRIEAGQGSEYLQVGAFSSLDGARSLVARLSEMTSMEVFIQTDTAANGAVLHKVRVGPLMDEAQARELVNNLESARLGTPFRVRI
jgi:rare lipoprotein A